jgi:two-component system KDP operon response regulator KdpE
MEPFYGHNQEAGRGRPSEAAARILVVDDDRQIIRMLRTALESSGYEVSTAQNGIEGFERFQQDHPDLIITDLVMPEMSGVELTQTVRKVSDTPIIVLSVRDADAMKVSALDDGADDYVTKPFNVTELLARVRALLRRAAKPEHEQMRIQAGDFVIDIEANTVRVRGEEVHLTPKEFKLLRLFARSPQRVLTHKVLLKSVWGPVGEEQPEYLRVLIAQLRKKIELPGGARYIQSEPWVGYRFDPAGKTESTSRD